MSNYKKWPISLRCGYCRAEAGGKTETRQDNHGCQAEESKCRSHAEFISASAPTKAQTLKQVQGDSGMSLRAQSRSFAKQSREARDKTEGRQYRSQNVTSNIKLQTSNIEHRKLNNE